MMAGSNETKSFYGRGFSPCLSLNPRREWVKCELSFRFPLISLHELEVEALKIVKHFAHWSRPSGWQHFHPRKAVGQATVRNDLHTSCL